MSTLAVSLWILVAIGTGGRVGDTTEILPAYRVGSEVSGEIRVSGSPDDAGLIEAWQSGFGRHHPNVRFSNRLHGPESTIAAVYTGVADIALMAREIREPMERMAFEWVKLTRPFAVEVANAGFDAARPAAQLAVYVHPDNPIESLSLTALDAIYGAEHKRADRNVRTWGGVGLDGQWANRPIRVMGPPLDSVATLFFRRLVLQDSRKWNPDYREFADDGAMLAALAAEPSGIAFAPSIERPGVRIVPLSSEDGEPAYTPDRETVSSRSYPLTRVVSVVLYRKDGDALEDRLREFLRFVLSADGQDMVERQGVSVPLSAADARRQRERLE